MNDMTPQNQLSPQTERLGRSLEGSIIGAVGTALIYIPFMRFVSKATPVQMTHDPTPGLERMAAICLLAFPVLPILFGLTSKLLGNQRTGKTILICSIGSLPALAMGFSIYISIINPATRSFVSQLFPGAVQGAILGAIAGFLFESSNQRQSGP